MRSGDERWHRARTREDPILPLAEKILQGTIDTVLTLAFAEAPARGLSDSEVKLLKQVYGDSVDDSAIRLKRGGSTDWTRMAPHVVGNTIYMRLLDGTSANDWTAEELSFAMSAWRKVKQGEGSR